MKLAEALSIRADLQKKVAQLKERIKEGTTMRRATSFFRRTARRCTR